jgi:tripartite-type tricarboxylate transporter receptor subunit TctC
MIVSRRTLLRSSAALAAAGAAPSAFAQAAYPTGQVRVIVPFPPGGGTDVIGRVLTAGLHSHWGQAVVQDYMPGASGLIGVRRAAQSTPDGYTLLLSSTGGILSLASSNPDPNYVVTQDLAPVTMMSAPPYILCVHPDVPVKTTAELIAYAKANPGKLTYGSSGTGTATHMSGVLFQRMANVEFLHVPYRGLGPATTGILSRQVDMIFAPATIVPHIGSGKLRAIGATTPKRSSLFPDIPTIAESGLPGYASLGWFGVFAPAKTPQAIVDKVSADAGIVLRSAEAKKALNQQGAEPEPNSPTEFSTFVTAEVKKWLELAKAAGVKLGG